MSLTCAFSAVTCEFLTVHLQTCETDEPSSLQVFKVKPADGIPLCSSHPFLNESFKKKKRAVSNRERGSDLCCNLIKSDTRVTPSQRVGVRFQLINISAVQRPFLVPA